MLDNFYPQHYRIFYPFGPICLATSACQLYRRCGALKGIPPHPQPCRVDSRDQSVSEDRSWSSSASNSPTNHKLHPKATPSPADHPTSISPLATRRRLPATATNAHGGHPCLCRRIRKYRRACVRLSHFVLLSGLCIMINLTRGLIWQS